jgi:hypothetical protein
VLKFRRVAAVALVAGTGLAAITGVGSAAASPTHSLHVWKTLPGSYVEPLQFSVSGHTIAVADSGASALFLVGNPTPIAHGGAVTSDPEASGDLAGVDIKNGAIGYTRSNADHSDTRFVVLKHGHKRLQVSLSAYEKRHNPDGHITYGVTDPSSVNPKCTAELAAAHVPLQYKGGVDSHPYAVAGLGDGSWLVADAGGNDLLRIDRWGHVSTVAVLPPVAVTLTADLANQQGVPDCVGGTYRFESVPTDVEVANGHVYVSTLSGSFTDGRVYEVSWNGCVTKLVGAIPGLTNIAVTPWGKVYLVELGQGVFAVTRHGAVEAAALPGAAAVEYANGHLYASTAPIAASQGADTSLGHIVVLR